MTDLRIGDCRDVLPVLAGEGLRAQCCVTSPPYWGLRDYGLPATPWAAVEFVPVAGLPPMTVPAWTGALGLEPDPWMYVGHMVAVFRLVRDVLAGDATLWLNLGDSYAATGKSGGGRQGEQWERAGQLVEGPRGGRWSPAPPGLKRKDLVGIPWRVALALQADGWWLRSDVIWHKPNAMPSSVTDRPTPAHEYVFLLATDERYYYDAKAISEPLAASCLRRPEILTFRDDRQDVGFPGADARRGAAPKYKTPAGWMTGPGAHDGKVGRYSSGNIERKHGEAADRPGSHIGRSIPWEDTTGRRNKRTVWEIPTQPFPDAHFATFPEALVEPCILAGSRAGDVVLDPFGGSGTVGAVAQRLGRRSVLIEANPAYAQMGKERTAQGGLELATSAQGAVA